MGIGWNKSEVLFSVNNTDLIVGGVKLNRSENDHWNERFIAFDIWKSLVLHPSCLETILQKFSLSYWRLVSHGMKIT